MVRACDVDVRIPKKMLHKNGGKTTKKDIQNYEEYGNEKRKMERRIKEVGG